MSMTITEKILARHADLDEVRPGMLINARVDIALGNDITAPISIDVFRKAETAPGTSQGMARGTCPSCLCQLQVVP